MIQKYKCFTKLAASETVLQDEAANKDEMRLQYNMRFPHTKKCIQKKVDSKDEDLSHDLTAFHNDRGDCFEC